MTSSDSWEERREHCRAQAELAEQRAEQASPETRVGYLQLAQAWLLLATEIDKAIQA